MTMKTKVFKCQKTIDQAIKEVTGNNFFLGKILLMNGYLESLKINVSFPSRQQKIFYKNRCSSKTCSEISVSVLIIRKNTCKGVQF